MKHHTLVQVQEKSIANCIIYRINVMFNVAWYRKVQELSQTQTQYDFLNTTSLDNRSH